MVSERDPTSEGDQPSAFLRDVGNALSDGRQLEAREIIDIAANAASRLRLVDLIKSQGVEAEVRDLLIDFIEETAEELDGRVDTADAIIELLDRAVLPIAIAAVLSGIGLLVSGGFGRGSLGLLLTGLVGLTVSSGGRTFLRTRANASKTIAKRLRRLGSRLKEE